VGSADIEFNRHLRVRVLSAQPISFFEKRPWITS
jgi:hypothetical protein